MQAFSQYLAEQVGPKWVIATRITPRLLERYPDSVVLTPKRYNAIKRQYRITYGDPDDPQRARLYRELRDAHKTLTELFIHNPGSVILSAQLHSIGETLKAEQEAR
jgi:hypothetical protein